MWGGAEPTGKSAIASLDALRGLAILLVIAAHFAPPFSGQAEFTIAAANAGVILFFFLSGFLMDRQLAIDPSVATYATRRAFRILPMYWISLILVAATCWNWTAGQIIANATFTAPVFGVERMLGVYWTLYIEVLFYCLAPMLRYAGDGAIKLSAFVALAGYVAFSTIHGIGSGAAYYLIFCLGGMQVGAWHRGRMNGALLVVSIVLISAGASVVLPLSSLIGFVPLICAGLLILCLQFNRSFRPLEHLGHISYSLYLLHAIVGFEVLQLTGSRSLAIAASVIASVAAFYAIERSAIQIGRRLSARVRDTMIRSCVTARRSTT